MTETSKFVISKGGRVGCYECGKQYDIFYCTHAEVNAGKEVIMCDDCFSWRERIDAREYEKYLADKEKDDEEIRLMLEEDHVEG